MHTFSELLKKLRSESNLTQPELAKILGVSTVAISMIEGGQKEAGKNFVKKLAHKLGVEPATIMPFVFETNKNTFPKLSKVEKKLLLLGSELQEYLIKVKAKKLRL